MKISSSQKGNIFEIQVSGRLDAYWSGLLDTEIEKAVHSGKHKIALDTSAVEYISSAGLRILLKTNNRLKSLGGKFIIKNPSANVIDILNLTGFGDLFRESISSVEDDNNNADDGKTSVTLEPSPDNYMKCTISGRADFWNARDSESISADTIEASENVFAIGTAAFGDRHESCKSRYGEFIAAAGTAAYLPTDNAKEADYMISTGDFIPKLHSIFSIKCEGKFSRVFNFEQEKTETTAMSEICRRALELTSSPRASLMMIAEIDGLAGAFLRKSPCEIKPAENIFAFPNIREWLSFTPEKAHQGRLAIVCGVVGSEREDFGGSMKPADMKNDISAHLHAAVFNYMPLRQGKLELSSAVKGLFSEEKIHTVMHLINDTRIYSGAGESVFSRGVCWVSPVKEIIRKGL